MLTVTSTTKKVIEILNAEALATAALRELLNRIVSGGEAAGLTDQERNVLLRKLGISDPREIDQLLSFCAYVFERATYFGAGINKLSASLVDMGLQEEKVAAFIEVWEQLGRTLIEASRKGTLGAPQRLSSINWSIGLTSRTNGLTKEKIPSALMQLLLTGGQTNNNVTVEFNHNELYGFLQKLDAIQEQVDQLMP